MNRSTVLAALAASFLAAACGGGGSTPAPAPAPVPAGVASLQTIDNVLGTGTVAASGNTVSVNYTGWLYSATAADNKGAQFDTSLAAGRTPLVFRLGVGAVIPGFEQGIVGMRVGGTRTILIPSALAYGATGQGAIPPNSSLVFTVTLLSVS